MNTEKTSSSAKVLGIISIIIALVSFAIAFIPLVGMIATITGAVGIILAVIAYFLATKEQNKGLILAAFIISIFSVIFAYWQFKDVEQKAKNTIESYTDEINQMESLDSLDSNVDDMEQRLDSL
ncbi:MAG: hypothetical protein HPY79_01735 [Bacteroidales bacterium]|nr:hypothetical protein [Bacteroidales bacterium]